VDGRQANLLQSLLAMAGVMNSSEDVPAVPIFEQIVFDDNT
jgi:hypothetical protein